MISATSKLQVIHTELCDKILRGAFQCGDRLPTTEELAKQFDCSVGMASKAIAMLVHSGLVEQRRGLGTRVLKNVEAETGSSLDLNAFVFIYPSEKHEGIWRTVKGFQDAAQEQGRRTITLTTGTDYKKEGELIGRLKEFDVKGAAVYSTISLVLACIHIPGMNRIKIEYRRGENKVSMYVNDQKVLGGFNLEKRGFIPDAAYAGVTGYGQVADQQSVDNVVLTLQP
ncbi:MAG: hypothetical protein B9S32_09815 [Verrucomicrobia bacterium Tous-C9LFEB]|nr:MAG: hypothetical protein B9S32_09815 [Verrucomicrobia bacterium Tous-C9LFEB]